MKTILRVINRLAKIIERNTRVREEDEYVLERVPFTREYKWVPRRKSKLAGGK